MVDSSSATGHLARLAAFVCASGSMASKAAFQGRLRGDSMQTSFLRDTNNHSSCDTIAEALSASVVSKLI